MTQNTSEVVVLLPTELEDIDASFLTAALQQQHPGTDVSSVEVCDLHQGSASSLRLRLEYAENPDDLPVTMFMKGDFIDHDFTSAAAFAGEALYFTHIADLFRDDIRQPHAYFSGLDDEGQAIVILEDLAARGARFGDCERPLDVEAVSDGVRQLAALQAKFWTGEGLDKHDWITDVTSVATLMAFLVQPDHFDEYIELDRAAFLSEPLRDRARVEAALTNMFATDEALPKAFVHGDPHIANTYLDAEGQLGFCDFQAVGRGPFIWDVTYFLTGALEPDVRSNSERELLSHYLDELRRGGVGDVPDLDTTFLAHRRHLMHGYLNILTPTQMQPDRFAVAMGRRFAAAMEDLDTLGSFD